MNEMLTVAQVATMLQMNRRTIRNWIASGYFKGWIKLKARWRIREKHVTRFLKEREKNGHTHQQ